MHRVEESQRLLDLAESMAGVGHWRMNLSPPHSVWSDAMYGIFGVDRETFQPGLAGVLSLCDDDDRARISATATAAIAEKGGFEIEFKIKRPDGQIRYVHSKAVCELDAAGEPATLFGVLQDVTSRVIGLQTISDSAERYRLLSEQLEAQVRLAEEQNRRLELAEKAAGLGHWRMDVATNDLSWSAQMYEIYGLDPNQPLDVQRLMAMTDQRDRPEAASRLEQAISQGLDFEDSLMRIRRTDGELRYVRGNVTVERGADGSVLAVLGTLKDVTAFRLAAIEAERAKEQYKLLADNANDLVLQCDIDGTVAFASPSAKRLTGFEAEDIIGRNWCDLICPEDSEHIRAGIQAQAAAGDRSRSEPLEYRFIHRDDRVLWFEGMPTLVFDKETGRPVGFTSIIRDVTARNAGEAELRRARQEAEAATAAKAEFLANMSHELRTPLTSIIGFVKLAAELPDLGEPLTTYLDRISNAGEALLCTVNDVLDFSKLEAGQVAIHCRPTDFAELARKTLDLFAPQAGAKDIALTLDAEADQLALSIDPDRIRQILLNLVGNAVKFTDVGGVTLRMRYDGVGQLRIEVIDTGAGVSEAQKKILFQRFSQVDGSLTRAHGGTGLGLAICKGLAEAMGGSIGLDSKVGQGSRFWFEIPALPAILPKASDPSTAGRRPIDGVRVLVADDHPANRKLASLFLAAVGAEVSEAENGVEAVTKADEWPFDVILMDINMPELDGPGALLCIRQDCGLNDATPILAFTAAAEPATVERLLALGFDGVVSKPLDPQTFLAAIAAASAGEPWQPLEAHAHAR